jgi:hypothetical protein
MYTSKLCGQNVAVRYACLFSKEFTEAIAQTQDVTPALPVYTVDTFVISTNDRPRAVG